MDTYQPRWNEDGVPFKADTHERAMQTILAASGVSALSYEEAVAVYLRARGILKDDARMMADPIPAGWEPPQGKLSVQATWRVLSSPAGISRG